MIADGFPVFFRADMRNRHIITRGLSLLLVVTIPLAILLISSACVLHMPQTYEYYFNDSESLERIGYGVEVSEMGDAISDYLLMPRTEPFQVYEQNGEYRDPIFSEADQEVMTRAGKFLFKETAAGVLFLLVSVLLFFDTKRKKLIGLLWGESIAAAVVTGVLYLLQYGVLTGESTLHALYNRIIGITLPKTSNLHLILGDGGIAGVYLMFMTVLAAALLALYLYIAYRNTRPERVFYVRRKYQ